MYKIPTITVTSKNHNISEKDFARFLKYVNIKSKNECWEWTGTLDKYGYGVFSVKRDSIKAHRFSYLSWYGYIDNKLEVCHSCDNPCCVNPMHLWQGTQSENTKDRHQKGRTKTGHLYGADNKRAKLNEQDVKWIRENYNPEIWSTRKLAKEFGVCQTNIRNILSYKSWRRQL